MLTDRPLTEASGRPTRCTVITVLVVVGLGLVAFGMAYLREAHLYRQEFGEGLKFVWVGMTLLLGGAVISVAIGWLILIAVRRPGRTRFFAGGSATVLIAVLAGCAGFAVWVESHGQRCVLGCPSEPALRQTRDR